jgi:hypothetical protein
MAKALTGLAAKAPGLIKGIYLTSRSLGRLRMLWQCLVMNGLIVSPVIALRKPDLGCMNVCILAMVTIKKVYYWKTLCLSNDSTMMSSINSN